MAIEIEAKMRLNDRAAMIARLGSLAAQPAARFREVNTFYDNHDGELKTSDQGLRIRVEQHDDGAKRTYLTHKGPRAHGKLKSRAETEAVVDNADHAAALLAALGYHPVISFEKRRERFVLDGCRVELDTLPYLGDFIEIEGPDEPAVLAVRDKLGLSDVPIIKASYIAMLQDHLRKEGNDTQVIRFPDDEPLRVSA